jgi:hypothetical protein
MEYAEIISLIRPFLKEYGIEDFDSLKPQTQKQLIMIETYLQQCIEKFQVIRQNLNELDLSVRGICKGSDIGKSTVYNNPDTLKRYIEKRLSEINCNIKLVSKLEYDALSTKVEELESFLNKTLVDMVEFENMRNRVEELEKTITRLEEKRKIIEEEKNGYVIKNNELLKELKKLRNNVITLKR